jgi:hypothetical protein
MPLMVLHKVLQSSLLSNCELHRLLFLGLLCVKQQLRPLLPQVRLSMQQHLLLFERILELLVLLARCCPTRCVTLCFFQRHALHVMRCFFQERAQTTS